MSSLDIHQGCVGHVAARCYGASFVVSHVVFRRCPEVGLNLPQHWDRQVAVTKKIAPGLDAWYDGLRRLNLFASGELGTAVLETFVGKRVMEHALHPERLYVGIENPHGISICYLEALGVSDIYGRVGNMMSVTDVKNGYPRLSSVTDAQMLIKAA